jgi:hypothetical protein
VSRFFLNLRLGSDETLDIEGVEMDGEEDIQRQVLATARDLMSHDIKSGSVDLRCRIDVDDSHGTIVHSLVFKDAVQLLV